jgi:diadenosine tetraphosphate (Ap4A) HIT family hydrolase
MRRMTSAAHCIFCSIVVGTAEASVAYRDDLVMAFLDLHPVTPGHTLVIPNVHSAGLEGIEENVGGRIWEIGRRIALGFDASGIRAEGANFFLANGAVAGQTVFHCHLHVIPRWAGDGFGFAHGVFGRGRPKRAELDDQARRIAATIRR